MLASFPASMVNQKSTDCTSAAADVGLALCKKKSERL
jgi:hypothetical protein